MPEHMGDLQLEHWLMSVRRMAEIPAIVNLQSVWLSETEGVTRPHPQPCSTLMTCTGFEPDEGSSFLQIAEVQALKEHF
jgi:hypothetical protein